MNQKAVIAMTNDFRTRLTSIGTGRIVEKSELSEYNGAKFITLMVAFARRRQESKTNQTIVEEDVVPIRFWSSSAEMINDLARPNQHIFVETEIRGKNSRLELKARHFELLD